MADKGNKEGGKFISFFSNPIVGIIGSIASVLGLLLAVYFFTLSNRYRDLVYYINPAKAVVVRAGQASRLRVLVEDKEIRSDVTAAQIAIWNQGKEPIHVRDILEKILIETVPSVPILEASIRKQSRNIIGLSLDESLIKNGILAVLCNILEENDGGVIQVVYAGGPGIEIDVSAIIEGQSKIRRINEQSYSELPLKRKVILWGGLIIAIMLALIGIFRIKRLKTEDHYVPRYLVFGLIINPIIWIAISLILIIWTKTIEPPFGF